MNVTNSVVSGNSAVSVCCRDCIERATQIETEKDPYLCCSETELSNICLLSHLCFVGWRCLSTTPTKGYFYPVLII